MILILLSDPMAHFLQALGVLLGRAASSFSETTAARLLQPRDQQRLVQCFRQKISEGPAKDADCLRSAHDDDLEFKPWIRERDEAKVRTRERESKRCYISCLPDDDASRAATGVIPANLAEKIRKETVDELLWDKCRTKRKDSKSKMQRMHTT